MILHLENLSKSYDRLPVISHLSMTLEQGQLYCLMGPSGSGKTTLFRMILGLEEPDEGIIHLVEQPGKPAGKYQMAAVFQENRLCEPFSPIENVMLATGNTLTAAQVRSELARLLPEEALTRPVSTFSGGMKRRTAIVRALLAPSQILVMDEPFTGLDEALKGQVIQYILEKTEDKLVLISTHQEEDVTLLGGKLIYFT